MLSEHAILQRHCPIKQLCSCDCDIALAAPQAHAGHGCMIIASTATYINRRGANAGCLGSVHTFPDRLRVIGWAQGLVHMPLELHLRLPDSRLGVSSNLILHVLTVGAAHRAAPSYRV